MIQLNLLPDVKKEYLKAQRTKATVIGVAILITMASVGLTLLLASIVYLAQPGIIALSQRQIDSRAEEVQNVQDIDKYLTLQNQLSALPGLHDQTVSYSRLFDFLKILNPAPPNEVQLTSLDINNESTTITMEGQTDGFKSFSVFEDTLANAKLTYTDQNNEKQTIDLFVPGGISVNDQSLSDTDGESSLTFSLQAIYNPEVFAPGINNLKLDIPNIRTSQSVGEAPNRAVFDQEGQ